MKRVGCCRWWAATIIGASALGACGDDGAGDAEPRFVITLAVAPENSSGLTPKVATEAFEALVAEVGDDRRVEVDDGIVTVSIWEDDPTVTLDDIVAEARFESPVFLRPVLLCTSDEVAVGLGTDGDHEQLLPLREGGSCVVGPAAASGTAFAPPSEAQVLSGQWGVRVTLSSDQGEFGAVVATCFAKEAACPTGQLAIEVDGTIVTAPLINAPVLEGGIEISGRFSEADAKGLAQALTAGSLAEYEIQSAERVQAD